MFLERLRGNERPIGALARVVRFYGFLGFGVSTLKHFCTVRVENINFLNYMIYLCFCKFPTFYSKYELRFSIIRVDKFMCPTNKRQNFQRDQSAIKQADNSQSEITRVELESPDNFSSTVFMAETCSGLLQETLVLLLASDITILYKTK